MSTDIVIIGAGLAGLACAKRLSDCGVACTVLEAADAVGGRVRTDLLDGFRLDRGFQLYLTSYPEGRRVLDYTTLNLKEFVPGALVRAKGKFHRVVDPRREPLAGLRSAFNPVGTIRDKMRLLPLKADCDKYDEESVGTSPDGTTRDYLEKEFGFTPAFFTTLLTPFFGGVFLDPTLQTSARFFRFVFRMFASGPGSLPELGMQRIPEQIAAGLPAGTVRLHAPVDRIEPGRVVLASGEVMPAKAVVVATDGTAAARLTQGKIAAPGWNGNATLYYAAEKSPIGEAILAVNGEGAGIVNTVAVLSDVSPAYAPPGAALISAAVIGVPKLTDAEFDSQARAQLQGWYGDAVLRWRLLRIDRIPQALPTQEPGMLEPWRRPTRLTDHVFVCGDHRDNASIDGALTSGYRAAQDAMRTLEETTAR